MSKVRAVVPFVLYLDGVPSMLINALDKESAEAAFRSQMMGRQLPEMKLQSLFDVPIEDAVRVGICAQMALLTAILGAVGGGGQLPLPPH